MRHRALPVLIVTLGLLAACGDRITSTNTQVVINVTLNGDCAILLFPVNGPTQRVTGSGGDTVTRGDVTVSFSPNCSSATVTGPAGTEAHPV